MNYYLKAWKNIFNYQSRSTRKDFWMFYAIDLAISASLITISAILFYVVGAETIASYLSLAYLSYLLIGIPVQISLWVRRFHDVGRSGWFYFMILIPIFGIAFLAYNACLGSQIGENKYGPNPYGIDSLEDSFVAATEIEVDNSTQSDTENNSSESSNV